MASENRSAVNPVDALPDLQRHPEAYEFLCALRELECVYSDHPRIGDAIHPDDEPLRFAQRPSLNFAPSTLVAFEKDGRGPWDTRDEPLPPRLEVFFFGLFGPQGPLPMHMTEYALNTTEWQRNENIANDSTFRRFADIFHHRMLSLFYRAWASAQPTVSFDRHRLEQHESEVASDRFARYVASLIGLGMESLRDRDTLPDLAKLHYAGLLLGDARNAEGLQQIVSDFLKPSRSSGTSETRRRAADAEQPLPTSIEEFVGQWLELPAEFCHRLGETRNTGSLGETSFLGDAVRDCQHKFRIVIGPVESKVYKRFLPGGDQHDLLTDIVRNYMGQELDWELKLILKRQDVRGPRLGESSALGLADWLGVDDTGTSRDAEELTLTGGYA